MARVKGIYRRGNIYWIRYALPNGRMRHESSHSSSFKAAHDILIQRKKEVLEGREPIQARRIPNHSFLELTEHYLQWAERQKSYRRKKIIINLILRDTTFKNLSLRHFNTRLIEEYQTRMLTNKKAPATVNRHIATIKHAFTKAVQWEMVEEDILKKVRRVKLLPENNRRLRYLSKEESKVLIDACSPHLKPIVIAALNTGMRKSEILSLEWDKHIDLKHGFILLETSKNGERREVPINKTLRATLQGLVRRIDSPYVFHDERGRRFENVRRSFMTACRRAGIKDFRFHDLRHTFASHLIMSGADLITVKELLGHKTLTMTLRYAHLAPSHKVRAVGLIDGLTIGKAETGMG